MALKPIKGVFAIPPSEATVADELLKRNAEVSGQQLDVFRESGWRFFAVADPNSPNSLLSSEAAKSLDITKLAGEAVDSATPKPLNCRNVYRDSAGQVVIEGAAIVIKFAPSVDASQVESTLDSYGLRVKRRLGFMPNGFEVQPAGALADLDLLELSNRLNALDEVEYAEPATIEAFAKRDVQR